MPEEPNDAERFPKPPTDEDIEARLRKVREELSEMDLPDLPDDEVDARTQRLTEGVGAARLPDVPEVPGFARPRRTAADSRRADMAAARGMGMGLRIAYTIVGLPMVGIGIGWLFDRQSGGQVGVALGVLVGMSLALYMTVKWVSEDKSKD